VHVIGGIIRFIVRLSSFLEPGAGLLKQEAESPT
jgi:hypothetical protein